MKRKKNLLISRKLIVRLINAAIDCDERTGTRCTLSRIEDELCFSAVNRVSFVKYWSNGEIKDLIELLESYGTEKQDAYFKKNMDRRFKLSKKKESPALLKEQNRLLWISFKCFFSV